VGLQAALFGYALFNPPRYLKLLEIILTVDTDTEIVEAAWPRRSAARAA